MMLNPRMCIFPINKYPMTVLCGLPSKLKHLVVEIDPVADEEKLTVDLMNNNLHKAE